MRRRSRSSPAGALKTILIAVITGGVEAVQYLNKLTSVMGTPDIKVITGVRRSGKSKLLESFKDYIERTNPDAHIIHINFNLVKYECYKDYHALNDYIEGFRKEGSDFVAIKRNEKIYIQVSADISGEDTFGREVNPLLQIRDAYPKILLARTRDDAY